jgi:radical SAM protein (TIGR01212 family)
VVETEKERSQTILNFPDQRRYRAWSSELKSIYGKRVQKVSLDVGFTCPNRDGTRGKGGCDYCNNHSFTPSYCREHSLENQLNEGIRFLENRYRRPKIYFAYFQSFSNTYAPADQLATIYRQALEHPHIEGLVISTRPDCLPEPVLDMLENLNHDYPLMVELGVETWKNETLKSINRCHSFEESLQAIRQLNSRGITNGVHMIIGLPGENRDDVLRQPEMLNHTGIKSIKLHQFQLIRNTKLAKRYQTNPGAFHFYNLEDYLELMVEYLEKLNPAIAVDRISGEVPPAYKIAPDWGLVRSDKVLQLMEKKLQLRNTWQGRLFKET